VCISGKEFVLTPARLEHWNQNTMTVFVRSTCLKGSKDPGERPVPARAQFFVRIGDSFVGTMKVAYFFNKSGPFSKLIPH
jgi:hypothetical protein